MYILSLLDGESFINTVLILPEPSADNVARIKSVVALLSLVVGICVMVSPGFDRSLRQPPPNHSVAKYSPSTIIRQFVEDLPPIMADSRPSIQYEFSVLNDGKDPLVFTESESSCSCIKGRLGKNVLGPGETTKLAIDIRVGGRTGLHQFSTNIVDQGGCVWRFTARVNIYRRVEFVPPHWYLGLLDPNSDATHEFDVIVRSPSNEPMTKLSSLESSRVFCILRIVKEYPVDQSEIKGVKMARYTVRSTIQVPAEESGGCSVDVIAKTIPADREVVCRVNWRLNRGVTTKPARALFVDRDRPALGQTNVHQSREFSINSVDGEKFSITSVVASSPLILVAHMTPGQHSQHRVVIRLDAAKMERSFYGFARLSCDHKRQPNISIPVVFSRTNALGDRASSRAP